MEDGTSQAGARFGVTRQQGQGDDDFELDMEGDEAYSQLLREISAGEGWSCRSP